MRSSSCGRSSSGARPQAEVELVTTIGAVVGTHARPGTLGFSGSSTSRTDCKYSDHEPAPARFRRRGPARALGADARWLPPRASRDADRSLRRRRADLEGASRKARARACRRPARPPPRRYEKPAPEKRIADLFGEEEVLIEGECEARRSGETADGSRSSLHRCPTAAGQISATWFNQPWLKDKLDAPHDAVHLGSDEPLRFCRSLLRPERGLGDGTSHRSIRPARRSRL